MRTLAILPLERFAVNTGLERALAIGSREAVGQAMFSDVLAALRRARAIDGVAVVTADATAEAAAHGDHVIVLGASASAGPAAAAQIGIRHALVAGFGRVLIVPANAPLIDPFEIDSLLDRSATDGLAVAIVADRHEEATIAAAIAPPDAIAPTFGPGSLKRNFEAADAAGLRHRVELAESLTHAVDSPDDLADLSALLDERRGIAPRTRGALRQLERSQENAPPPSLGHVATP